MKLPALAVAFALAASVNAEVPSLTPDNYDELTDGKTVFIKFFAPWCGHCKKMAPDWEKLSADFADDKFGYVAEVDCTTEGKPLCDANGVRGFPTLKYGDPTNLEDYQGGRSYDDLSKFAKENLKPVCSPANIDLCDKDKKSKIEEYMKLGKDELAKLIEDAEKELEAAETWFKDEVQKLQDAYKQLSDDKDKKIADVKDQGLGLMKSVKNTMDKKEGSDEL